MRQSTLKLPTTNTVADIHWCQGLRRRDKRPHWRRSPHLNHGFHRFTCPRVPLLVAVVQKLLGHYLTESYFDCKPRYGLNDNGSGLVLTNHFLVLVCFSVVLYLLLRINPNSPMAPPSLVPLGLAAFSLPLGTNVIVTTLIAVRIWYLSPRKARNVGSAQFPTRTGQAAIDIVVESGMLYLAVQLVFVTLFAIRHPAQGIVGVIAVQIYVSRPHP